ncbi:hypothetical protein AB0M02_33545 [Actinoplanes sp. NPDC051861]|uniref:hypothetical protein n=1 Tax=Actinoplanes sp. NPDC051861 TaxID=3155170 RepID=UPI003419AB1C
MLQREVPEKSPGPGAASDAPVLIDTQFVEKIKAQALIDAGFARDQDGDLQSDEAQLKVAVVESMKDRHVARSRRDLAKSAVTKFELYAEMLPHAPGVKRLPQSIEESVARDQLMKKLWSWLNVGITGFVQVRVGELGYVLCEGPVARTKLSEETGKRQPTTEAGRFLTSNHDLILDYYTGPAAQRFLAAARKLEAQIGLVVARRPELETSVSDQVGVVVRQAVGSIPHADTGSGEAGRA